MNIVRAFFRFLAFAVFSLLASIAALLGRLFNIGHSVVYKVVFLTWRRCMILCLNVRIVEEGERPDFPAILMANHRSYVDVLMIRSAIPYVFVAKASVRKWPIVGWGGDGMKTVWVERSSANSRKRTREQLRLRLQENKSVVIFPEGTTFRGPGILALKPGMFHTVAEGGFTVVPIAIEYRDPAIAWIDDDLFIPHFVKQFGKRQIEVKVVYGKPISGTNGEELRQKTADFMSGQVLRMRREWDEAP